MNRDLAYSYLDNLLYNKKYSFITVRTYYLVLNRTLDHVELQYPLFQLSDNISKEMLYNILKFARYKQNKSLASSSTYIHSIVILNKFSKYLKQKFNHLDTPFAKVKKCRSANALPSPLSYKEISKVIQLNDDDFRQLLFKTIFCMLFASGLRVSEAINLKTSDIDISAKEISVRHGKGNKSRVVPFSSQDRLQLRKYLKERSEIVPGSEFLFVNTRGEQLNYNFILSGLNEIAKQAGLFKHITPHMLRHAFATELLKGGADIRSIQEMLGHSTVSSTQIYTKIDYNQLKEVLKKSHPAWNPCRRK